MKTRQRSPQPFLLKSDMPEQKIDQIGVLLIHGFTGSTAELRPLGTAIHREGYTVHAPLLKGHGVTPEEMKCTTWVDWYASAKKGYEELRRVGCEKIVVVGLSMGGLLALKIAQFEDVIGMVTLCAPIKVRDKRMGLVRYLQYLMHFKKRGGQKEEHIEKELYIYDKTPLSCVVSLDKLMKNVRNILPELTQPILIVQSEKDETVDPCSGELLYNNIGSTMKELSIFKESSHIITLDKEREELFATIIHFIEKVENNKKYQEV